MGIKSWMIAGAILLAGSAAAEDARLKSLDTSDAGRGWDAVGRLDIAGKGFCTGALIAPNLVLTAAHCLYDSWTKERVDHSQIEFLAGWRNGQAKAYRSVRRAVVHPEYVFENDVSPERVRNDVALLELQRPIISTSVVPFATATRPRKGDKIGIVSYAHDRAEAPSLQEVCSVMARQSGMLVMSCNVDFGSSGAPVFTFAGDQPQIVSVVSAKAEVRGQNVSLGTALAEPLALLQQALEDGEGYGIAASPRVGRIQVGGTRNDTGAKFIKP